MAKKLTKKNIYNKITEGVTTDVVLEGEESFVNDKIKNIKTSYKFSKDEERILKARIARFEVMLEKKKKLGINAKCDAMDILFSPHLVGLNNPDSPVITNSGGTTIVDEPRKSTPMAFEKITSTIATLIRENPKVIMKAFRSKFKKLNLFIENVYYENFKLQSKIRILQRYTYQLSKYGIAYWREYIKRTYRKNHEPQRDKNGDFVYDKAGNLIYDTTIVYDVNDQVAEVVHPKNIVLDDGCLAPTDPQRPARDLFLYYYYSKSEFDALYPVAKFPKATFVKQGQSWMFEDNEIIDPAETRKKDKIQVIIYENKTEDVQETWSNGIPLESIPLPGHKLDITGDKWVEDGDNYDGIGIGQILAIYQPMVDDINNASIELLRQLVRPVEDFFNNAKISDESDDVEYHSGSQRRIDGSPEDVKYSKPPAMGAGEIAQVERLMEEIDRATMVPKHLSGVGETKTAFEAAQNKESALAKLNIPLFSIKWVLEQAANISLSLWPIVYGEAEDTKLLNPGDDDFNEALAIYKANPSDERVALFDTNKEDPQAGLYRREFRQMELPLSLEEDDSGEGNTTGTGRIVYSDERKFWELVPKHFNWIGRIEIISSSFLPISKALEDDAKKEMADWLISVPVTDELGRPTLTDANGKPYVIDKARVVKDRISILRDWDAERLVVPMDQKNAGQGNVGGGVVNPLNDANGSSVMDAVEMATDGAGSRPELRGAGIKS